MIIGPNRIEILQLENKNELEVIHRGWGVGIQRASKRSNRTDGLQGALIPHPIIFKSIRGRLDEKWSWDCCLETWQCAPLLGLEIRGASKQSNRTDGFRGALIPNPIIFKSIGVRLDEKRS